MPDTFFSRLLAQKDTTVSFILHQIRHVTGDLPPREPGSAGERRAAEYMAQLLRKACGCSRTLVESFDEHPQGFYGYLYFSAVLDLLCCACCFFAPWLSLLSGTGALLLMLFQFILYHEVVDRFFPLRQGTNVTAVRPCRGTVRRRVFFSGHMDAAWEWPLNYYANGIVFEAHSVGATVGVLYYLLLSALRLGGVQVHTAACLGLVFVPFWVGLAFLRNPRRTVDGANDNLTGCFLSIGLLEAMERMGIELDHTEVGVILTGSEECGLRGAKAWCRAHREAYRDVPTLIYGLDTIHSPGHLMTNERDLNGTVMCDRAMSSLLVEAASELGLSCRRGWIPPMGGATDSAAFSQAGFRSVALTGMAHGLEPYYHTRRDTCDCLNPEALGQCFAIMVRALEKIDGGALDAAPGTAASRS